ncbi:MAG: hypothetical protein IT375_21450 [Polyangiaceae bacterium]|nr:hypothetical protein [Polyangiaceae bacterium]
MPRWPEVDRALRQRLLDEMRRRQNREASLLTPALPRGRWALGVGRGGGRLSERLRLYFGEEP